MIDLAAADELLTTTRSVRRRLDLERPVPPEVIEECLQIAVQAPTASNRQLWRWLVITDEDLRVQVANLYREGEDALRAAHARVPADDRQTLRTYDSAFHLTEVLHRVPVLVIPCIRGRVDGEPLFATASHFASIVPATWSFMLALRARGLGSVLTTLHLLKEKEVAQLLGIPDNVTQLGLLPVAYTVGTDFRPADRGSVGEITYWNGWKAS